MAAAVQAVLARLHRIWLRKECVGLCKVRAEHVRRHPLFAHSGIIGAFCSISPHGFGHFLVTNPGTFPVAVPQCAQLTSTKYLTMIYLQAARG